MNFDHIRLPVKIRLGRREFCKDPPSSAALSIVPSRPAIASGVPAARPLGARRGRHSAIERPFRAVWVVPVRAHRERSGKIVKWTGLRKFNSVESFVTRSVSCALYIWSYALKRLASCFRVPTILVITPRPGC